jgi:hypothetical protein
MAQSTDEIALIILVAVQAEQNREPKEVRRRLPLGVLTKQIMLRHGWQVLEFLQGWGLITTEKLAEVKQVESDFYPGLTEAGRNFILDRQADNTRWAPRPVLLSGRDWLFVAGLVGMLLRFAYVLWKANN